VSTYSAEAVIRGDNFCFRAAISVSH